ncbi:hypothetical protein LINPERHAP2_LOCUS24130 [Linum perenne]
MTDHTIDQLNSENENKIVIGRVCRKWRALNTKSCTLMHLDLILIDEKGDQIHVQIPRTHEAKYTTQIQEQQVYKFTNFKMKAAEQDYKPVKNPKAIQFTSTTIVQPMTGKDHILKDKGTEIKVTIWNNVVEQYKSIMEGKEPPGTVLLITGTFVTEHKGNLKISSSSATKIIVEPELPEVHHNNQGSVEQETQNPPTNTSVIIPPTETEEVTLQDLHNKKNHEENKDNYYFVTSTIVAVRDGWNYIGCLECMRRVEDITDDYNQDQLPNKNVDQHLSPMKQQMTTKMYHCSNCKKTTTQATRRYQVKLNVMDNSGEGRFVLLDYEGVRFFDNTADQLHTTTEGDRLPQQILNMVGKKFTFKIKLNTSNLINPYGEYAISKIAPYPEGTTPKEDTISPTHSKGKKTLTKRPRTTTDDEDTTEEQPTTDMEDEIKDSQEDGPSTTTHNQNKRRARVIIDDSE